MKLTNSNLTTHGRKLSTLILALVCTFTTSFPLLAAKTASKKPVAAKSSKLPSLSLPKISVAVPTISLPSAPSAGGLVDGGVIGIAGKGMSLLSLPFTLEAKVQAAVLGFFGEIIGSPFRFNSDDVRADLRDEVRCDCKQQHKLTS